MQRDEIAAKYEHVYRSIYKAAVHFIANFDGTPEETYEALATAVPAIWSTSLWAQALSVQGSPPTNDERQHAIHQFLSQPATWLEGSTKRTGTSAEFTAAADSLFVKAALPYAKGSEHFIDLGCGWGHRMIDMYRAGLDALFFGGDRSKYSRLLTESAASLFPKMRCNWFQFDFLQPDLANADGEASKVCLYTCHAIEQVTTIGPGLIDAVLQRYPHAAITGIHLEPISFQMNPSRRSDLAYAERKHYNMDLYETVRMRRDLGIERAEPVILDAGDGNATSLLVWSRK